MPAINRELTDLQYEHAMKIKSGEIKIGDTKDHQYRIKIGQLKAKEQPLSTHSLQAWQQFLAR